MSGDISRVYTFLAANKDWITRADQNNDNIVKKTEFRNFMKEEFTWNPEETIDDKMDLINRFWSSIDTEREGFIKNTDEKNLNAVAGDEIKNMNNKIEVYEKLNEFTSNIQPPTNLVSNIAGWKKSVSEGLAALVEPFIQEGGKAEDFNAYLQEHYKTIEQKATADYCANEYITSTMSEYVEEYGYAYANDNTLKNIIDTYIKNIPEDATLEDIKAKVIDIINNYKETATPGGNVNTELLREYNYDFNETTPLNDLQKCILKKNIEKSLESIRSLENYDKFKDIYEKAILDYTTAKLTNTINKDYNPEQDWLSDFKKSKEYKKAEKLIDTKEYLASKEFKEYLSKKLGDGIAKRIGNSLPNEIPAYAKILDEAFKLAEEGKFDNENHELDIEKLNNWLADEIQKNIKDFYPNGLEGMSIKDLNQTYDTIVESSRKNNDADSIKQSTIDYCRIISSKSELLAQAVAEVFGENYIETINRLLTGEIEAKMKELKAKVEEIGDPSTYKIESWNNLPDSLDLVINHTETFELNAQFKNISPDRIKYTTNSKFATIDGNILRIKGPSSNADFTVKIYAYVDGARIEPPKTIKIVCREKDSNKLNEEDNVLINGHKISDLIKKHNKNITISDYNRNGANSLKDTLNQAKDGITTILRKLSQDLIAAGYNPTKVESATATTISYYSSAIDAMTDQQYSKGRSDKNMSFTYTDANGNSRVETSTYWQTTYYKESSARSSANDHISQSTNSTGLILGESYHNTNTYMVNVNIGIVLQKFMSFMNI